MNDNLQWVAFKTIVYREINRFTYMGTNLSSPSNNNGTIFFDFGSLIGLIGSMDGFSYMRLKAPGLIMMSIIQNSMLMWFPHFWK